MSPLPGAATLSLPSATTFVSPLTESWQVYWGISVYPKPVLRPGGRSYPRQP